jgi:cytochrome c oxidase assembly protein subunit 15
MFRTLSPDAYRKVTLVALLSLAAIIVTGAVVRLTGSGLGCSDWPTCERGQLAPSQISDAPAMVEFVNRTITGIVSVAVILAVLGALRRVPYRRDLTWLAVGLVAGVLAQIVLGGLVVLFELSPRLVMGHFLLSMVLVWNAVVLHERSSREATAPVGDELVRGLARLVFAAAALVIFLGTVVTAAGPHAGDEQAARLDLLIGDVARLHAIAVWVLLALTLGLLRAARRVPVVRRATTFLLVVLVAQGAVGYTQYFTGVPAVLVGVHVAGAIAVWWAATHLLLSVNALVPLDSDARTLARAG